MRRASTSHTIGVMLWVAASSAQAMGFGQASNSTVLGQRLHFETTVRLADNEDLGYDCVFAEVYAGENKLVQPLVRIDIDPGKSSTERIVRVRTVSVIVEPVVSVILTLGCDSRLTRKFVAFVDPPAVGLAQSGFVGESPSASAGDARSASSTPVAAAPRPARPSAASGTSAEPTRAARPPRATARAPGERSTNVASAPRQRRAKAPVMRNERFAAAPGPRLQLDPAPMLQAPKASAPETTTPPVVPPPADLPASGVMVAAAPVAASQPAPDVPTPEQSRLLALEESLKRVRDETQAAQKALATLQLRIRDAESQRYANPLVYALAVACALLALAVFALWRRQARVRNEAKWYGTTVAPSAGPSSQLSEHAERDEGPSSQFPDDVELPRPSAKVMVAPESAKAVWVDSRQTEPSPDLVPEPRRDLSVEELIDLEQQAEFFVVLGQDDAAIDLLMGHVRSTGGISPLPYLKLLEIYRRRGDRSAYERIRERFNRRFNAYAPDWDADLQQGRSLEDYPATIARLEALWVMPSRVMETLEASLFRRDETEEAFDLPAYRELLFLYAVARDFAHKADDSGAVDLLLPMDNDAPSAPVSRLVASMPSILERRGPTATPAADSDEQKGKAESPTTTSSGGLSLELGPLDLGDEADKPGDGRPR